MSDPVPAVALPQPAFPDNAGPPDFSLPGPSGVTFHDVLHALNPLQHLPGVGMIYRAATGDEIPHPLRILGAGLLGGPAGMLGSALFGLVTELIRLGPDHSRPPVPAGFTMAGAEAGMEPVSPGTLGPGQYTTLATTEPGFLRGSEQVLMAQGTPGGTAPGGSEADPGYAARAYAAVSMGAGIPGQGMA